MAAVRWTLAPGPRVPARLLLAGIESRLKGLKGMSCVWTPGASRLARAEAETEWIERAEDKGIVRAVIDGMSCVWTPGASRLARAETEGIERDEIEISLEKWRR